MYLYGSVLGHSNLIPVIEPRNVLCFTDMQIGAQSYSDGGRKGIQFSWDSGFGKGCAEHHHLIDSQSQCTGHPCVSMMKPHGKELLISVVRRSLQDAVVLSALISTIWVLSHTNTHIPCALPMSECCWSEPMEISPSELNYSWWMLWW